MSTGSGISWTDDTMNSLYGCWPCSSGCRLCYAVKNVHRASTNGKLNVDGRFDGLVNGKGFTGELLFDPKHLYAILEKRESRLVFVNEFSDLMHEALPMALILEHFRVFRAAPWHQFQVLTKRHGRLAEINSAVLEEFGSWPKNVWMGVSVCSPIDKEMHRIECLGATEAALKWISFEPWISDLDVPLRQSAPDLRAFLVENKITWTVVGGESGARDLVNLMTLDDARYIIESSRAAGCKVHFKQLGAAFAIQRGVYSTRGLGEHRATERVNDYETGGVRV